MDIKRLVIGMALAMALMFGWQYFIVQMYKHHPEWKRPGQETAKVTNPPATQSTATTTAATAGAPTTGPAAAATTQGAVAAGTGAMEIKAAPAAATATLGSDRHADRTYALQLTTTNRGAGIDRVVLNDFWATVKKDIPYTYEGPFEGGDNAVKSRVLATQWISVNGQQYDLADQDWVQEKDADGAATYSIAVGPVTVRKSVQVRPRDAAPPGSLGFEVRVTQTIQNTGNRPVSVATAVNGPVPPPREIDYTDDRQVIAGYQADGSVVAVGQRLSVFTPEKPSLDLNKDKNGRPAVWVGASSSYFDAILRPLPAPAGQGKTMPLHVAAEALNPDEKDVNLRLVTTSVRTDPVSLAPGEAAVLPMDVFFGPKQRSLLNNAYYSAPPLGYDATLSTNTSSCYSYCTFGWLTNILVALLSAFHWVVRDWGLAIILLVAIVRVCLHPITKRSQVSMMKMGKMGPEIERLKKKYGDNKEELNKAMMQVYKEQGATPILGCLPMLLQTPIWIALYASLQNTFELRHAPFLYGLTWIHDLAKPDRLFYFPNHPVNLVFIHFDAINLLPILMAVVYWLNQKFTPRPPATTPEQEQQQKMMQWMSLLFPIFLYNGPAGLNLYIVTSTGVGIIESKRIRAHIKQREEAEKEGRVFVEPTRKMRGGGGGRGGDFGQGATREPKSPKGGGGIAGWLADLQEKAEEMRRNKKK